MDCRELWRVRRLLEKKSSSIGVEKAVLEYLQLVADTFPNGRFPNGLSAEDTARVILETAKAYVTARDQQAQAWTPQQVREVIGKNLKTLNQEQAVDYLARLQLVYKYFSSEAGADLTEEAWIAEYEHLRSAIPGMSLQAQIDRMVDTLDVAQTGRFLDFAERSRMGAEENTEIGSMVEQLQADYPSYESMAICGAVIYAHGTWGKISGLSPHSDPGEVTARAAAYMDAATVAIRKEKNGLTDEEVKEQLGKIGNALATALAMGVMLLTVVGMLSMIPLIIVMPVWLECVVGIILVLIEFDVFIRYEDIQMWFCRKFLEMKKSGSQPAAVEGPKQSVRS